MARPVAGDPLKDSTPILSPKARPVDTYVRPGKPVLGKGEALANALGTLDRVASPILEKEETEAKERDIAEGEEAFRRNREDFKTAVRKGIIPAGASPYVRKGYRRAQLHTLGANYAVELRRSLEESELYKVDDPAAIEQHIGDFYNQFLESNRLDGYDETELAEAFTPMVQQAHDGFRAKQAEKNIEFIEAERFRAAESEILSSLDMHSFSGSESRTAIQNMSSFLAAKAEELESEGHDRTKISRALVDIITGAAEARTNPEMLAILENTKLGTGPLSDTQYGRTKIHRAQERIEAENYRNYRREQAQKRAAKAEAVDGAWRQFADAFRRGDESGLEDSYAALSDMDGKASLAAWRAMQSRDNAESEEAQKEAFPRLLPRIENAPDYATAQEIIFEAVTNDSLDMSRANQWLERAKRKFEDPEFNEFYTGPRVKDQRQRIVSILGESAGDGLFTTKSQRAITSALDSFNSDIEDFYLENGGKPPVKELSKFIREARDRAIEDNQIEDEFGDDATEGGTQPQEEQSGEEEPGILERAYDYFLGSDEEPPAPPADSEPPDWAADEETSSAAPPELQGVDESAVDAFTNLQASFGQPLTVTSGIRSPDHNASVGGADQSRHMEAHGGDAIDIDTSGMSREETLRLLQEASEQGFTGIGVYDNSIHLDRGPRRAWGPSYGHESVPEWAQPVIQAHMSS